MAKSAGRLVKKASLVNALGLHARAAAKIAKVAQKARAAVRISHGEQDADAASVLDILTLACGVGAVLKFTIEDPEDCDILQALVDIVNNGFGEKQA